MRTHILIGFVAAFLLGLALTLSLIVEPMRMDQARADLLAAQIAAGQIVYAENCAVCHNAAGEGLGANPALDNAGLRETDYDTLYKTVARGRYNTAMPAWSVTDGGPLTDAQIHALIALIQSGDWARTRIVVADMGLAPRVPISVTVPIETLNLIAALPEGDTLSRAVQVCAANCVVCHASNGQGASLAPALNDPLIRSERSADQLINTIALGVPGTVMAGWKQRLSETDIADLAVLIQRWDQLPADAIPEPPAQPIIVTEKLLETGAALYQSTCSWCHGSDGQGTRRAPALNVQSFFEKVDSDAATIQIVTSGVPGTAMPAWGDRLSASEIEAIVAFVRQWEASAPAVAAPQQTGGGGPPWQRNNTVPNPQPQASGTSAGRVVTPSTTTRPQSPNWSGIILIGVPGLIAVVVLVWSSRSLMRFRS